MSRDGRVALPCGAMGLSAVVVVVFPDHTRLLFLNPPATEVIFLRPVPANKMQLLYTRGLILEFG